MDVLPDIQLQVDKALKASNPALFCTKLGSPITFHLQVGEGEENLIKSVKRTVNSFGGRYIKRYHQMTPYTALLVTDLGFKSRAFNRPAICVTYIGDCVHTNSLRNVNEYLHPWEDSHRWDKVDLFDVMYSLSKMFDCSLKNVMSEPFVPVSRVSKTNTFVATKQIDDTNTKRRNDSESSELIVISSEDEDLFETEAAKSLSVAATNTKSSSPVGDRRGALLETQSLNSENSAITKDVHLETLPVTTEKCLADDRRFSSKQSKSQPNIICPPGGSKNSTRQDSSSKLPPTVSKKVHQELPNKLRESIDQKHNNKHLTVLIYRLPEDIIRDATSNYSEISRQTDPKVSACRSKMSTSQSKCRKDADAKAKRNLSASNKGTIKGAITEKPLGNSDPVSVETNKNSSAKGLAELSKPNVSPLAGTKSHSDGSKSNAIASEPKHMKMHTKQRSTERVAAKSPTRKKVQYQVSTHGPSRRDDTKMFPGNSVTSTAQKRSRKDIGAEQRKSIMVSFHSVPSCSRQHQGTARTLDEKPSGNSHPPTVQKKTCEDDPAEECAAIIVSSQSVLSRSDLQQARTKTVAVETSDPSSLVKRNCTDDPGPSCIKPGDSKDSASTPVKSGKRYLQLQISINNSTRVKHKQRKRKSMEDELLSDGERSSISDVQYVPQEFPKLDITDESYTSHQNSENDRVSQHLSTSLGLMTPKEEKEVSEPIKRRGRGYQDRYRKREKVALLKWLVEHKKFKNLRGVLVWQEIERKKVLPGRSCESLKNQFLKHLVKDLDAYAFLTEEHKKKLKGQDVDSSDEEGFFYHASSHLFAK